MFLFQFQFQCQILVTHRVDSKWLVHFYVYPIEVLKKLGLIFQNFIRVFNLSTKTINCKF